MPSTSAGRVDPLLTTIGAGYRNTGYIADRILPIVTTAEVSARYPVWGKEAFRVTKDNANPKSAVNEVEFEYSTSAYTCEGHALSHFVPNAQTFTSPPFNELQDATDLVMDKLLLNREKAVADYVTSASYVPNSDSPSTKWDAATTAIIAYIEARKDAIEARCGVRPNRLVIGQDVLTKVKVSSELIDRVKYTQRGMLTTQLFAELLDLDEVIVSTALYDSANEGQTFVGARVWPAETGLLYYAPTGAASIKTPSLGKLLYWTGAPGAVGGVQVLRTDVPALVRGTHGGTLVGGVHYYTPVITASDCAERLTNLLT